MIFQFYAHSLFFRIIGKENRICMPTQLGRSYTNLRNLPTHKSTHMGTLPYNCFPLLQGISKIWVYYKFFFQNLVYHFCWITVRTCVDLNSPNSNSKNSISDQKTLGKRPGYNHSNFLNKRTDVQPTVRQRIIFPDLPKGVLHKNDFREADKRGKELFVHCLLPPKMTRFDNALFRGIRTHTTRILFIFHFLRRSLGG